MNQRRTGLRSAGEDHDAQKKPKRSKYTSQACLACQRRKIRCSGHETCSSCLDRGLDCVYDGQNRKRRRTSHHAPISLDHRSPATPAVQGPHASVDALAYRSAAGPGWPDQSSAKAADTSLAAQAAAVKCLFGSSSSQEVAASTPEPCRRSDTITVELPPHGQIKDALDVFFESTNIDYPIVERKSTEKRIFHILECMGYPAYGLSVQIDDLSAGPVALLNAILAIAETFSEHASSDSEAKGHHFYRNCQRLLLEFQASTLLSMDVVRCHALSTIYLLQAGLYDVALQSIAAMVRLAMSLQRLESNTKQAKVDGASSYDKNLWPVIYILDRTVSRLAGMPHLVRDEDASFLGLDRLSEQQHGPLNPRRKRSGDSEYLRALVEAEHLYGRVWDELLAGKRHGSQVETVVGLDALLRLLERRLPPALRLKTDLVLENEQLHHRQRLAVFTKICMLRLLLASCLVPDGLMPSATELSAEIIQAASAFENDTDGPHRLDFSICTSLVQCVLALIRVIHDNPPEADKSTAVSLVETAYETLMNTESSSSAARGAVKMLDDVLATVPDVAEAVDVCPSPASLPAQTIESPAEKRTSQRIATRGQQTEPGKEESIFQRLQSGYVDLDNMMLDD